MNKGKPLAFLLSLLLLSNCSYGKSEQMDFLPQETVCYAEYPSWFVVEKNTDYADVLFELVQTLPDFVKETIQFCGAKIILSSSSDELVSKYGDENESMHGKETAKGLYDYNNNLIWIVSKKMDNIFDILKKDGIKKESIPQGTDPNSYFLQSITLHEIGHFIDYQYGSYFSETSTTGEITTRYCIASTALPFQDAMKADYESFHNIHCYKIGFLNYEYYIRYSKEYFATSFAIFILEPEELLKWAPNTYNYMQNFFLENEVNSVYSLSN